MHNETFIWTESFGPIETNSSEVNEEAPYESVLIYEFLPCNLLETLKTN